MQSPRNRVLDRYGDTVGCTRDNRTAYINDLLFRNNPDLKIQKILQFGCCETFFFNSVIEIIELNLKITHHSTVAVDPRIIRL